MQIASLLFLVVLFSISSCDEVSTQNQREKIQSAVELLEKGSISEGLNLLEERGKEGNDEAFAELGSIYEMGHYVRRNFSAAVEYYTKAANLGNIIAQRNLGYLYDTGKGTPENIPVGLVYHSFAAIAKDLYSSLVMGYKYSVGIGVPKSCEEALISYQYVASKVIENTIPGVGITFLFEDSRLSEDYDSGKDRISEQQDIVQYYQYSADTGDAGAQVTLGGLYLQGGYGVARNYERAFNYFDLAAQQKDPGGLSHLGLMYSLGLGVEENNETAISYYRQAVEKNHPHALTNLGYMYLYGYGVPKDIKQAHIYFKQAAEKNYPEAIFYLGVLSEQGWGVKQDLHVALQYFTAAASHGHAMSMYYLGTQHMLGIGTPRSCKMALTLFKKVVERDSWDSILDRAHQYFHAGDIDTALLLYEKAAEMGFEIAQSNAAFIYDRGLMSTDFAKNDEERFKKALRYFQLAAEQVSNSAFLKLGDYYFYGLGGLKTDHKKAVLFYRHASEMRNAQATFNLGYMHQHGFGLPQDFYLAKRYYDMASELNPDALVPVALALMWLGVHFVLATNYLFLGAAFLTGIDWDDVLIAILFVILAIALIYRRILLHHGL